jgi:acyl carrier protein
MTNDEFVDGLRKRLDWPGLSSDTALKGNERWDSLAKVDVVMYVQDELGYTLPANELERVDKVQGLVDLLSDKLN